ncbi:MAG: hypothetical protein NVS4B12_16620 [Ktedonobacteraceae bacterium]
MDTHSSTEEATGPLDPGNSALTALFACGLEGSRKGHATEILLLLALAHEQLPAEGHLQTVVENLIYAYERYLSAQQALQEASKQLFDAEAQLQATFAASEKLLANVVKDVDISSLSLPPWFIQLLDTKEHQEQTPIPIRKTRNTLQGPQPQRVKDKSLPALDFTCFSHFEVKRLGQTLVLCTNRSGQAILRYLIAQPGHRASVDKLTGVLWPETESEVARRRLQVAISELRCSLNSGYSVDPGGGYILFKDWVYQLNPAISFHSDVERFLELYQAGRQTQDEDAITLYEQACQLYTGDFLVEDIYADWSFTQREQLSQIYQKMCNTLAEYYLNTGNYEHVVKWASIVLKENGCDEAAHRQLINAYAAQGRRSEALRQFQRCVQTLKIELGVAPMPETVRLCQSILAAHPIDETENNAS